MKKTKQVFIEDLHMETQTVFYANGDINISPCGFELGQHIVSGKDRVSQRGRMVTEDDGTSRFRPYMQGGTGRFRTLCRTAHGEVKESQDSLIVHLRLGKRLGKAAVESLLREEFGQMRTFIHQSNNKIIEW